MAPYREDVVYTSEVLTIRWERRTPDAPRELVVTHDPGAAGVPEQRRLPEGFGLEALGGVFGLLGLGALLLHRLARRPEPRRTEVRLGAPALRLSCGDVQQAWAIDAIAGFGAGEDSPEWRTVFVEHAGERELLLEGLPRDDAARALEALREALAPARAAIG